MTSMGKSIKHLRKTFQFYTNSSEEQKRGGNTSELVLWLHYLGCSDGFMGVYMSKLIKLCTLNMCNFLYVNYTTVKVLRQLNQYLETVIAFTILEKEAIKLML